MKSPEQILKEECGESYYLFPHQFSKKDIIGFMEKYADQFKNPPKKTIEERKRQFGIDLDEVIGQPRCYNQLTIDFFDYWTEHGPNDKKMRFEKEKSFDIKKRLDRWKRNQKQPTHGRKSADEAIGDLLSN